MNRPAPSSARAAQPLLTVIVPAFNEGATIERLLARVVAAPFDKQVVVVDDGSTDRTAQILDRWHGQRGVQVVRHAANRGKGHAIRTGLALARGRFTIIQDADLEYDPGDYPRLIEPLLAGTAQAVFGSRYLAKKGTGPFSAFRCGVALLNLTVRLLYGAVLTDEATCYKVLPTHLWRRLDLQCERFEFCPEVTAKLCRLGIPIVETPVSYDPRGAQDGKKIRWRDGLAALRELWRWRSWRQDGSC
ncbi:MAG: glycosyltransferase family 2 protein [Phycisphaerae bacterium]